MLILDVSILEVYVFVMEGGLDFVRVKGKDGKVIR